MPPKPNLPDGVTCAEGISLLYLLHPVPAPPSRNSLSNHTYLAQGYTLSLHEELCLVESLAFLSNVDHNINRIPAVCVRQTPGKPSLSVLLAVNQSERGDGSSFLRQLREGFEPIFALLAKPRHDPASHVVQEEMLAAIISMCSRRILLRLRLVAGRKLKTKPPIQAVLRTAISSLKQAGRPILGQYLALSLMFVEKAKDAIKYAEAWAKHQTMPRLQDLVNAIHSLRHTGNIEAMLATLPNKAMDPSMRSNTYNMITKIARYHDISRKLLRMSTKQGLLRAMNLITVELPRSVWSRSVENSSNRTLASVFSKLNLPSQKQGLVQVLRTLNATETEANQNFMAQTRRTLSEAKIHAEVQLVYYCELNPSQPPPRIIASSKDACYLCNAFISMHGKMHTSRTHGRLYPGWRLPIVPNLVQLEQRFDEVLAAQIRVSVATLVSRGRKTVHPDPNESTLLSLVHSESTMPSAVGDPPDGQNAVVQLPDVLSSLPNSASSSSFEQRDSSNAPRNEADDDLTSPTIRAVESFLTSTLSQRDTSLDIQSYDETLVLGRTIMVRHDRTFHTAGSLELHVELPSVFVSSTGDPQAFKYSLEWITPENENLVAAHGASSIVDLEALRQETTVEVDDQGQLLISAGGVVVKINRYAA